MKVLLIILVLFLSINIGLIYYFLFFGEFSQLSGRLDLIERRIETLATGNFDSNQATNSAEIVASISAQPIAENQDMVEMLVNQVSRQVKRDLAEQALDETEGSAFGEINQSAFSEYIPKTFYVPIGQATAKSSDNTWKNTPVEVDFNSEDYGDLEKLTFEATLRIPTGNGQVKARLYDTQAGVVAGSEIVGETIEGVYVKSSPLVISEGERTLRLQILTTLDFDGVVENARIKVERK